MAAKEDGKVSGFIQQDSAKYWGATAWDPDHRVYVGASEGLGLHHLVEQDEANNGEKKQPAPGAPQSLSAGNAEKAEAKKVVVEAEAPPDSPGLPKIDRMDSASYWSAEAWDPEERIYTGAEVTGNHKLAVQPADQPGKAPAGLTGATLGASAAPPPVAKDQMKSPSTQANSSMTAPQGAEPDAPSMSGFSRRQSDQYWCSDAWDPEERIYVGGESTGAHRLAVQPDQPGAPGATSRGPAPGASALPSRDSKEVKEMPNAESFSSTAPSTGGGANASGMSGFTRRSSAEYWCSDAWDPEERVYVGGDTSGAHRLAVQPDAQQSDRRPSHLLPPADKAPDGAAPAAESNDGDGPPTLDRRTSSNLSSYWTSEAWDPDCRVYIGAEDGSHMNAVQDVAQAKARPAGAAAGTASAPPCVVSAKTTPASGTATGEGRQRLGSETEAVTKPGACPKTLAELIEKGCRELGHKGESKAVVDYFARAQWISTISELQELADEDWFELRLPVRLKRLLRKYLALPAVPPSPYRGPALPPGATGGPPESMASPSAKRSPVAHRLTWADSSRYFPNSRWLTDDIGTRGPGHVGDREHLHQLQLADGVPLQHVWKGGLTSHCYGLGDAAGPQVPFSTSIGWKPTLDQLYSFPFENCIGKGGFGVVRQAVHKESGITCALKAVSKATAGAPYAMTLVGGLGKALLSMSKDKAHENLVRYLDILEGQNFFYIVMEELNGPELLQQMEEFFPAPAWYLSHVLRQVCQALSHLHNVVGLFHRDVKLSNFRFRSPTVVTPKNIRFVPPGTTGSPLVLLDFGAAAPLDKEWDGLVCGTMMFMPPELAASLIEQSYLAAIDMWSTGVILYILLTGERPFEDSEVRKLAAAVPAAEKEPEHTAAGKDEAEKILRRALSVPALASASVEAKDLLTKLLTIDPSQRLKAADAVQHPWVARDIIETAQPDHHVPSSKYKVIRRISQRSERVMSSPLSLTGSPVDEAVFGLDQPLEEMPRILSPGWDAVPSD